MTTSTGNEKEKAQSSRAERQKTYLRKGADLFILLVWRGLIFVSFQFSFRFHNPFLQGLFVSFGLQNEFLILVPVPSMLFAVWTLTLNLEVLQLWVFLRGSLKRATNLDLFSSLFSLVLSKVKLLNPEFYRYSPR